MSKSIRCLRPWVLFLAVACVTSAVEAAPNISKFLNKTAAPAGKKHVWVARRHSADPNNSTDVAIAFQILDSPLGANELQGVIHLYDKEAGGKYQLRKSYFVTGDPKGGGGGGVGEANRRRETCVFTGSDGTETITVYATLFKGKDHGNAAHRRLVIRYRDTSVKRAKGPAAEPKAAVCSALQDPAAAADEDCCESEPNDDVLEEEPLVVDPMTEVPEIPTGP